MKSKNLAESETNETITQFGDTTLSKTRDGKWRLEDGGREDRLEAQEWISQFLREALVGAH